MKIRKMLLLIVAASLLIGTVLPFSATAVCEDPQPVFTSEKTQVNDYKTNNLASYTASFVVNSGIAVISARYDGYQNVTTGATITMKLQKKVWFWWSDVDNDQPNNTWTNVLSGWKNTANHYLALNETGEYRAIITFTVYGTGGPDDFITETVYNNY